MKKSELLSRWTPELTKEITRSFLKGQVPVSPFDAENDFRGFEFRTVFENVVCSNIDFSYCRTALQGQITRGIFTNCKFLGARIVDTNLKGTFERCDFGSANLTRVDISGGTFIECEFVRAKLPHARVNCTTFKSCSFKHAQLDSVTFHKCAIQDCDMLSARLSDARFYRTTISNTAGAG